MTRPILWTFRRCPYAMRARLAIASSGVQVELREILLRDKPSPFLTTSPKGTVPVVEDGATVVDESLDVMLWALNHNDPEGWLDMPEHGLDVIENADGAFKTALDRYKYASRHSDVDADAEREKGGAFLRKLEAALNNNAFLFGDTPRLSDMAILPFVRQFAHVDLKWFEAQPWPSVARWLAEFKASERFRSIMTKYPPWMQDQNPVTFPQRAT